jgi:phosphatidate cytidylyltransferase
MTGPEPTPDLDLRAAHRARHMAAAPDAFASFDDEDDDGGWAPGPDRGGAHRAGPVGRPPNSQLAGEDWPAAGDPAGGWRLARESGDPYRPARSLQPDLADMRTAEVSGANGATGPPARGPAPAGQPARRSRAGRNLPAAIGVGVVLAALVVASLLLLRPAFYAVIVIAVWVATWEMVRAVAGSGLRAPLVPLLLGGTAILGIAWYGGAEALPYGLLGAAVAILVWRLADGPEGYQRDVVTSLLIATYVPFLGGFVVLLLAPEDGNLRVLAMIAGVVLSDTGGYVFGVFLGRRKLAPSVSPGKSWEGFGGSVLTAAAGGALIVHFMLDGAWYWGIVFGVAVAVASTLGDLAESLLKRDLGVKDMSALLPGHGGLMDRLDSILLAAPVSYAVLTFLVPPG